MKIDFSKVKVLWSKQKEAAEEEEKRQEELRIEKEREHERLNKLVKFCKDVGKKNNNMES
jgi:hypothetical protein